MATTLNFGPATGGGRPPVLLPNKPLPLESLGVDSASSPAESSSPGGTGGTGSKNKIDPHWHNLPVTDQCTYCSYVTDRKDRMRRHIRTVHFKDKPFQCGFCPHTFGRKDKMKRHEMTVHHAHKPIKCDHCHLTFARKDKLLTHVNRTHPVTMVGHIDPLGDSPHHAGSNSGSHKAHIKSEAHHSSQPATPLGAAQFPPNGLNLAAFNHLGHVHVGPPLDIKPVFPAMSVANRLI